MSADVLLFLKCDRSLSLSCDVFSGKTIELKQGRNLTGTAELILYTYTEYRNGAGLGESLCYSGTKTADDVVLFCCYYTACLLSRSDDHITVKGLDGVDVDNLSIDTFVLKKLLASSAL